MKKALLIGLSMVFLLVVSCKKDKGGDDRDDGQFTKTNVQVVLPPGSSVDLSKATIYTLAKSSSIGADGKSEIPYINGTGQISFVFDEAGNLVLAAYITATQKEISIKTTAQLLLFNSLQLNFLPDSAKNRFLERSAIAPLLTNYYTQMETAFKADNLMLEKRTFKDILILATNTAKKQNIIDLTGKQIEIVDDGTKSNIEIKEQDVENVNIINSAYRRAHSFIYKTAFRDLNNLETVINSVVNLNDAADQEMKVEKIRFLTNAYDQIGVAQGFKSATTGPILLPVTSNEKEATYKIRVLGPGAPANLPLTDAEKLKLEELYYEYLAYDIIAPLMLDATGYRSLISSINEDALKPFYEKIKIIAKTDPAVMNGLKQGSLYNTTHSFFAAVTASNQSNTLLSSSLINCMKTGYTNTANIPFPTIEELQESENRLNKGIEILKFATGVVAGPFILAPHEYYNELEEFEVKSRDNDVKLTPKNSSVSTFTNHALTANANINLTGNQTMLYKWYTTGNFGILKYAGQPDGTTMQTSSPTINYYGNAPSSQLGENNFDKVVVTAYIKDGSTLTEVGADTATINVKKNKLVMLPNDATLNLKNGGSKSVKLYLLKEDGTKDIIPNSVIDYKVEWNTAGTYGTLSNGATSITTYDDNSIIYTAFDDEAKNATENISARVYFKAKNDTKWTLRQDVKGKVKIDNDPNKLIYYTSIMAVHVDPPSGRCVTGGLIKIKPTPNALSYAISATGLANKQYSPFNDAWSATDPSHIRGYAGYAEFTNADAGAEYWIGVTGTWSWSGGPTTKHFGLPDCSGTVKVTVTLSQ